MAREPEKTIVHPTPDERAKRDTKATKDAGAGVELHQDVDPTKPAHQEPYPTGTPYDPEGREVFKQAHGYYPDEPPIGTPPGQAEAPPEGRKAKAEDEPVKKGR